MFAITDATNSGAPVLFLEPTSTKSLTSPSEVAKRQTKQAAANTVEILAGKDAGKQGRVVQIIKECNWCFVEGLNCEYEMAQIDRDTPGQCLKKEMPLLVTTEVALVDPSDEKPTAVEWRYTEQGQKARVSSRTGLILELPPEAEELEDFVTPSTYKDQDKDTREKELTEITFEPVLNTFEKDIMKQMGISDERKPAQTYWW